MKIKFERPLVPNFVRTDKGNFGIWELEEAEFEEYVGLTIKTLREKYQSRRKKQ